MNSCHHLLAVASASLLLPAAPAPAEVLEPVVVTASRRPVELSDSLSPVVVIDHDEIERSLAQDVAELLKFHAGLEIARNGGPGQLTSLFIRGADSDHTLVLIDGVKVNPGTAGGAALQNISPELVERIEVVKGPRSALYGSEAIGGVVNIITRRGPSGAALAATAGGGRYDTRGASASASWRGERFGAGIAAARYESAGFPPYRDSDDERGFENDSVNLWAQGETGPLFIEASHWQANGNTEYSDFFRTPQDQDFDDELSRLQLQWRADAWASGLLLSRFVDDIRQGELAPAPGDFVRTERRTADWQNDLDLVPGLQLTAGLTASREETSGQNFGAPLEQRPGSGDVSRDEDAAYLQAGLEWRGQRFLAAGRHTDHESFGGINTWNLEWGTQPSAHWLLRAGTGRGFRAPSSADLYAFGGNPALDPEVSRSWDAGAAYRLSPRQTVSVDVFRTEIDQLIEFVDPDGFQGPAPGRNENVGDARIEGAELGWRYAGEAWGARAGLTIQDPENLDTGEPLLRRARRVLTVAATRRLGAHQLGLQVVASDERRDFGGVRLAGYALANLTARAALSRHWSLRARLENLLDTDYELVDGYNTAGRGLYASLTYNY